ncbi:hypothetical protein PAXRUDRAFT_734621 [Paxillus rubicundulus Ve08.2h10]|uniref:Uncharacterized protein n=1 Tax=Paxillus rubicundulus Ve08.2h10 TaxID=930991 RepID=A0A0D0CH36_9AGAM|nr:hypothetical protein PAXRUDRAFT_734621 [Paxillus rubicundulus Ve08.2h10]
MISNEKRDNPSSHQVPRGNHGRESTGKEIAVACRLRVSHGSRQPTIKQDLRGTCTKTNLCAQWSGEACCLAGIRPHWLCLSLLATGTRLERR